MTSFLPLLFLLIGPATALAIVLLSRNRSNPKTLSLLVNCYFVGMLAIIPALMVFGLAYWLEVASPHSLRRMLFYAFVVAAFGKELGKYLVLRLYAMKHPSFTKSFHGITMLLMIAMGYVTSEAILIAVTNGWVNFSELRIYSMIPAHITFAVLMGFFTGLSKFRDRKMVDFMVGLGGAVICHGIYEITLLTHDLETLLIFGGALIVVSVLLFIQSAHTYLQVKQRESDPLKSDSTLNS